MRRGARALPAILPWQLSWRLGGQSGVRTCYDPSVRAHTLWICVSLPACAQLAGIDKTTGGGDAGPTGSSLTIERYSIGATIVEAPQPIGGLPAPTFFIGSDAVPGVASGSNAWTTDQIASAVLVQLPNTPPELFEFPALAVTELYAQLERPGATPPPAAATVDIELSLPSAVVAGETFEILDVGAWSTHALAPAVADTTIAAPGTSYASFASATGRPLDAIGAADAILALRYTGPRLSAVLDLPGFAQTGADTISGTLVALPATQTLGATVSPDTGTTRLATVAPLSPSAPVVSWSLQAAPGYRIAATSGVQLTAAAAPVTDLAVTATYANPFATVRDWHTVFTWVIHSDRAYTPPAGALATQTIGLTAQLVTIREPGDGAVPDAASLDAGLPTRVTLGATPLVTDGLAITDDPTTPLVVTVASDHPTNTLYRVSVIETTLAADMVTPLATTTFAYTGVDATFTLPANTLVAGHTYRLRAQCFEGGFPGIATGDLTMRALPLSFGLLDSGVFTVGAPR